jgi:lipoprotein-anchoring transpeptidase ErfK/SrfK
LQDLFVKRMKVGIGARDTPTPSGYFRVVQGGKTKNSPYQSPREMGALRASILPGEPNYPLDAQGHNMKIEGIPALGTDIDASQGYALHGTNEAASIGKMGSMGCLRFGDKDIELLYGALQDYAAPNDPRATWTRWSTVTIQ